VKFPNLLMDLPDTRYPMAQRLFLQKFGLFTLVWLVNSAQVASGAKYYIAISGTDANTGTASEPLLTIQNLEGTL